MPFPIAGALGGLVASRLGFAGFGARLFRSPLIQGGSFGVGYTGGSYLGYGASNTWDPFSLHGKNSNTRPASLNFKMPYGSYGRRRYSRYSGRYSRYSGYTRYRRYRRRRPYYSRRSYY